jgi:hypothetical protein
MKEMEATIFGFAETNTSFFGPHAQPWAAITRRTFKHSKSATSESDIKSDNSYKPGGTMTTIVGKWQSRVSVRGSDASGLGRWSYLVVSSNRKKVVFITAYRPCKTTGPHTPWTQQWIILREKQQAPDPIKSFDCDLEIELWKWSQNGHEIILMIDTNEEIRQKPGGINAAISKSGLHDILAINHSADKYPNTYARGSQRLDYIFGTEGILCHCKSSGILPFGFGYPSNHQAVFIKIDLSGVLSSQVQSVESSTS